MRQKHFSRAEQIADHIHPRHQWPFDHGERLAIFLPRFLGVLINVIHDPFDQRVAETFLNRSRAPLVSLWPKERMTIFEFFQLGFRIALMPSSLSLAALAAAKEMLLELKETGTERDYFSRQKNVREVERWYRDLHMRGQ